MPSSFRRVRGPATGVLALALCVPALADSARSNVTGLFPLGSLATSGVNPRGDLLLASDGNFYLTASSGGASGVGSVLRVTPAGTGTVLHSFAGAESEGTAPYAGLVQASDGALYGTTYFGGAKNLGTVFRITTDGSFTNLFSFTNESSGGFLPYTGLTQVGTGDLFGTTLRGGTSDAGTVFRITLAGSLTKLHDFNGSSGRNPEGRLAVGPDGALYGTTLIGGASDRGTIYRITPDGTLSTLYSFPSLGAFTAAGVATNIEGANPRAGLTLGPDGNFYGTAYQGGAQGYGTVFRVTPTGALTVLHSFQGAPADGANPLSTVAVGPDGSLYGTTEKGGSQGVGVTWRIDAAGRYEVLHPFSSLVTDGNNPYAGLLPLNGFLYGLSFTDATYGSGVLYRVELPAAGALPVSLSATPDTFTLGAIATLTWNAPGAASCNSAGAWTGTTVGTTGTQTVTPTAAGIYTYILACTDAGGVTRSANAFVTVTTPALQPVDGGGDGSGGGSMSPGMLALLGGLLALVARRRRRA